MLWMGLKAVIVVIFAVGFLVTPVFMGSVYGMSFDDVGTLLFIKKSISEPFL